MPNNQSKTLLNKQIISRLLLYLLLVSVIIGSWQYFMLSFTEQQFTQNRWQYLQIIFNKPLAAADLQETVSRYSEHDEQLSRIKISDPENQVLIDWHKNQQAVEAELITFSDKLYDHTRLIGTLEASWTVTPPAFSYKNPNVQALIAAIAALLLLTLLNIRLWLTHFYKPLKNISQLSSAYVAGNANLLNTPAVNGQEFSQLNENLAVLAKVNIDEQSYKNQLRQAQQQIKKFEQRTHLILNSAGSGIYLLDGAGRVMFANTAAIDLIGWTIKESIGVCLHNLIQKSQCEINDKTCRDCLFQQHPVDQCAIYSSLKDSEKHVEHDTFISKDGTAIPVRYVCTPIIENAQVTGLIIIFDDISSRLASEKRLKDSEALKQAMLESSIDAIITIDNVGLIVEFNENAEIMFGYKKHDVLAKSMAELIIPERYREAQQRGMNNYFYSGAEGILRQRIEMTAIRASGEEFPVELMIAPIHIHDDVLFTGFISDITERTQARIAIENARIAAETANIAKSQFLAAMSHEIRTPLNALIGVTDLLLSTQISEEQAEYLRISQQAGISLQEVVNNILDFSKIEAGKMELDRQEVKLLSIVDTVLAIMCAKATEKGLELVATANYPLPETVLTDSGRVKQVLLNLVANAIKFTKHGSIEINLTTEIDSTGKCYVLFTVIDTGIGVSDAEKKIIFEEFSQADLSTTRKYGGTGLGLAIASRLVAMMGGRLGVNSEAGNGSTFWFTLGPIDEPLIRPEPCTSLNCLVFDSGHPRMRALLQKLTALCSHTRFIRSFQDIGNADNRFNIIFLDEQQLPLLTMGEFATFKNLSDKHNIKVLVSDVGFKNLEPTWLSYFDKQLIEPIQFNKLKTFFDDCVDSINQGDAKNLPTTVDNLNAPVLSDSGKNILLVEDNLVNQFVIKAMLEKAHHKIDIANNGAIAVEMVTQKFYDIILMDLSMPIMGGMEAAEKIRQSPCINQHTPIIALTASVFEEKRKECFQVGMNGFLSKPLNMLSLQAEIHKHPPSQQQTLPHLNESATTMAAVLDVDILNKLRVETSEDFFSKLLKIFLHEGAQRIEKIEQAIATQDFLSLKSEIHSLKSESATFGAVKLSELSNHIDLLCHQDKKEQAFTAAKSLKELWLALQAALSSY